MIKLVMYTGQDFQIIKIINCRKANGCIRGYGFIHPKDNSFESAKKIAENLKLFTLAES